MDKCPTCLANFTGEHTCDPLMKELVKRKKEKIMWALVRGNKIIETFKTKKEAKDTQEFANDYGDYKIVKVKVTIL